jgi:glycerol-3-phosphate dehydrogenase
MNSFYDIIIIGGGIHGAAIAADASGRGLKVLLCEQGDLACATSSASSKLLHGGLRYLEHYDFGLVRESLRERDKLSKMAPHIVHPLRFIVPVDNAGRPLWLVRLGLYLYDLMGYSRYFKRSKFFSFQNERYPNPLKSIYKKGIIYSDATVDDARLVITTALRAKANGATILTRTKCVSVKETDKAWQVQLENQRTKLSLCITADVLINACGPWMNDVVKNIIKQKSDYQIRLVKGSHIVIPKITLEEKAYLLQHPDGRVIFVVPYHNHFTMIGTTDIPFTDNLESIKIDPDEIDYLCNIISAYFKVPILKQNIVSSWSGVRPLILEESASPSANTREYKIELVKSTEHNLPLINIYGGKLTTHRNLAEKAVDMLKPFFPKMGVPWTSTRPLPGGDLPERSKTLFLEALSEKYPWLSSSMALRYTQTYGTLTYQVLGDAQSLSELGEDFGQGLYEREIQYLIQHEWAMTTDDILWRRTKLGLFMTLEEVEKLNAWIQKRRL